MMLCTTAMALLSYSLNHGSLNALIGRPFLYCSRRSLRSTQRSYDWMISGLSYISGYALSSPAMRHHCRCTYQSPFRLPPRKRASFHASSSTFVFALIVYHSVNMCVWPLPGYIAILAFFGASLEFSGSPAMVLR